jgi:hypothetical protein
MTNNAPRCALCGGPVDQDGRAVASVAYLRRRAPMSRPVDDPSADLSPGERYARAVERRNALIRDRRMSKGRRDTDQHP